MIFTSAEGEESLFPDYFILPQNERLHGASSDEFEDNPETPRVDDIMKKISFDSSRVNTSVIGEIDAGWADEGVNPETFWLGYIAGVAAGWHPGSPSASELSSTFYSLFYGKKVVNMDRVYQLMSDQAQSWNDSWDPYGIKGAETNLGIFLCNLYTTSSCARSDASVAAHSG